MFKFIKNWLFPAGKYNAIPPYPENGNYYNKKGESKNDLFARRDAAIVEYIRNGYPVISMVDFMNITTDKTADRYRIDGSLPDDNIGVIVTITDKSKIRKCQLYRIEGYRIPNDSKIKYKGD